MKLKHPKKLCFGNQLIPMNIHSLPTELVGYNFKKVKLKLVEVAKLSPKHQKKSCFFLE